MNLKIGHAANPNKEAAGQVTIANYSRGGKGAWNGWIAVLRPKTASIASKSAAICVAVCENNNVLYSQPSRATLQSKALSVSGKTKLSDITVDDIKKINTTCYADCSSFMSFCASAAGATIDYNEGIPYTGNMKKKFAASYTILTDAKYLSGSSYLEHGDILLSNSHTAMIVSGEPSAPEEPVTYKIVLAPSLKGTNFEGQAKMYKIKDGKETQIETVKELNEFTWSYSIFSLTTNAPVTTKAFSVTSSDIKIKYSNLAANTSYFAQIEAKDKLTEEIYKSAKTIFSTSGSLPREVTGLTGKYSLMGTSDAQCSISFSAPYSWGTSAGASKIYKVCLIVNGKIIGHSDSLIIGGSSPKNKVIKLNSLVSNRTLEAFTSKDAIQLGIIPGLKLKGDFIYNKASIKTTSPYYISYPLKEIDKIFIKIKNNFNRVVLYNRYYK